MPTYEAIFDGKIGIEFVAGFDLGDDRFSQVDFSTNTSTTFSFSASRFIPELGARYYINSKQQGKGLYIGPYLSFEILLDRDEDFASTMEEVFQSPASGPSLLTSGLLSSSYGINFGNKWIFKKHWIIDIFPTLVYSTQPFENSSRGFDFDVDLKIGYRF